MRGKGARVNVRRRGRRTDIQMDGRGRKGGCVVSLSRARWRELFIPHHHRHRVHAIDRQIPIGKIGGSWPPKLAVSCVEAQYYKPRLTIAHVSITKQTDRQVWQGNRRILGFRVRG